MNSLFAGRETGSDAEEAGRVEGSTENSVVMNVPTHSLTPGAACLQRAIIGARAMNKPFYIYCCTYNSQ